MKRSDRLVVADTIDDDDLARELADAIDGEVRFDTAARAIYSHDASNYRMPPIGVVLPRHAGDVEHVLRCCRARGVPVLGRGGGTSLAGQCVNRAVVMDFSKYMHAVVSIDRERRRVRVQPGIVLDELRAALRPYGLFYGPDPGTHGNCTLGGMIGNNSCGVHSMLSEFYGPGARTSDHVESLDVITYDGLRMRVGAMSPLELSAAIDRGGREGAIYRALVELRDRNADEIRRRFAPIPRRVSGYNLDELLPERGFHVARALAGTESTCVTIVEAELVVYPDRPARAIVALGYPDVFAAGDHIPRIREFKPVGLEGLDDRLAGDLRATSEYAKDAPLLPAGNGWLLVEFGADTGVEAESAARALMTALARERGAPAMKLFTGDDAQRMREIREAGLAVTAFPPGQRDALPGWEDSAVAPEQLGGYLRALRALFDRYGYKPAVYGHFGQGCVHCSIDFDLSSRAGIDAYRRFTADAAELVTRFGGSLSGEHGDGQSRGELLVVQFGDQLVDAFRAFKRIWDPDDRMNPGKIVDGLSRVEDLKYARFHPAPVATHFHPHEDGGDFRHAAVRCQGIGKCRHGSGATMCPSFQVTHDEQHTTRGRARALFELMQGDLVADGWASDAVKDTLDLCLACKGCKRDCPVHVDMATYKSEFLSHYYEHHPRPRHAYAFGWIHRWALIASQVPALVNFATQMPGLRAIAARLAGMAPARAIPRFAQRSFQRWFKTRGDGAARAGEPVVLWPDTFDNYFFPETLAAAVAVLEHAGFAPIVPRRPVCCGRALYDYGMLPLAKQLWQRTFDVLAEPIARGWPVVALEPSCAAAFRDELPSLFPDDDRARALSKQTRTLAELLADRGYVPPRASGRAIVQAHCQHRAVLDWNVEQQLLAAMALDVDVPDPGCCGLAGSFGYEADHYDISMAIGERVLLPAIRAASPDTLVIADGFSCREQIQHGTGRTAFHFAEVLAAALYERPVRQRTRQPTRADRVISPILPV